MMSFVSQRLPETRRPVFVTNTIRQYYSQALTSTACTVRQRSPLLTATHRVDNCSTSPWDEVVDRFSLDFTYMSPTTPRRALLAFRFPQAVLEHIEC